MEYIKKVMEYNYFIKNLRIVVKMKEENRKQKEIK